MSGCTDCKCDPADAQGRLLGQARAGYDGGWWTIRPHSSSSPAACLKWASHSACSQSASSDVSSMVASKYAVRAFVLGSGFAATGLYENLLLAVRGELIAPHTQLPFKTSISTRSMFGLILPDCRPLSNCSSVSS